MYIQISEDKVLVSRKLAKAMEVKGNQLPSGFIQMSLIKGTSRYAIIKRTAEESFKTQCSALLPTGEKRTPYYFNWTIPSIDMFLYTTGMSLINTKILKVKERITNNIVYYEICNK